MKEIVNKEIKLTKQLIKKINLSECKTIDLIKFLTTTEGISYNKKLSLNDISLSMLAIDGYKIKSAMIDTLKGTIILTILKECDYKYYKEGVE